MDIEEVAMAGRIWADTAIAGFEHALDPTNPSEHAATRRKVVLPTALGAGVVIGVSLLERLAMDKLAEIGKGAPEPIGSMTDLRWVDKLNLALAPGTREELENFIRLRHCFAHEYGRATHRQDRPLRDYLNRLAAGEIEDEKGNAIALYYSISVRGEISLKVEERNRLRNTLWFVAKEIESAT